MTKFPVVRQFETVSMVSQRVEAYTLDHTLRGICIENRTQQNATPRHVGCFHHTLRNLKPVENACLALTVVRQHLRTIPGVGEGQP